MRKRIIIVLILLMLTAFSSNRVVRMKINTSVRVMCPADHLTVSGPFEDGTWKLDCWVITTQ